MGGGDDSPETALMKVTEKTGDSVTVQVMLKDMISQISGASFELTVSGADAAASG